MKTFFTVFERRMFQTKLPALINLLRNSDRKGNTHRELMRNMYVSGDMGGHERETVLCGRCKNSDMHSE